jgi:hypothetical protein
MPVAAAAKPRIIKVVVPGMPFPVPGPVCAGIMFTIVIFGYYMFTMGL